MYGSRPVQETDVGVEFPRPDTQAIRRRWQVESHQAAQGSALQASGLGFEQRVAALERLTPAFIRATIVGERLYRSIPSLISYRCIADLPAISERCRDRR
ncbi:MAG: hypothetical protein J7463_16390 [Roseiflexus sp.]|nr:hypothetical protein [Roseiflexus sp.]